MDIAANLVRLSRSSRHQPFKNHALDPDWDGRTICGQLIWAADVPLGHGTDISCLRCVIVIESRINA